MDCSGLKSIAAELVDDELDDARARAAREHARTCAGCASAVAEAEADARRADDAVRAAVGGGPSRKDAFVAGFAGPARPWTLIGALAAAAAVILAILVTGRDPAPAYEKALAKSVEERLANVAAPSDPALAEALALETAAVEERLAKRVPAIALADAARELGSSVLERRVGARRALAAAPRASLVWDHPYVRALRRGEPVPEGEPTIACSQSSTVSGVVRSVDFKQYASGVVHVKARDGERAWDVKALDVDDLRKREPDLCERFGIAVKNGAIQLGTGGSFQSIGTATARASTELFDVIARVRGDAAAGRIREALRASDLDAALEEMRSRATEAERARATEMERMWREVRRLERLAELLRE